MLSGGGNTPVLVLNTNTKRESGKKAQFANIQAAKVPHPTPQCAPSPLSF